MHDQICPEHAYDAGSYRDCAIQMWRTRSSYDRIIRPSWNSDFALCQYQSAGKPSSHQASRWLACHVHRILQARAGEFTSKAPKLQAGWLNIGLAKRNRGSRVYVIRLTGSVLLVLTCTTRLSCAIGINAKYNKTASYLLYTARAYCEIFKSALRCQGYMLRYSWISHRTIEYTETNPPEITKHAFDLGSGLTHERFESMVLESVGI